LDARERSGQTHGAPDEQRQGIGGGLLAALLARNPGATHIRLTVAADNRKDLSFYERQGFAPVGEVTEASLRSLLLKRAAAS
jgi:ribosomal protein S18 acetylase RimI-like enzyme